MFRKDFISPTGLIRRRLIYPFFSSLPQFPPLVAPTGCAEPNVYPAPSVSPASSTWRAGAPFPSSTKPPACQAASSTASGFGRGYVSAHGELHNSMSHTTGGRMQTIFLILETRRADWQGTQNRDWRRCNTSDASPEQSRRSRGKLSILLLCSKWTRICVSNKEPFLY